VLARDCVVPERLVVAPALKHLRDEPLHPPATTGHGRVKEHKTGLEDGLGLESGESQDPRVVQLFANPNQLDD